MAETVSDVGMLPEAAPTRAATTGQRRARIGCAHFSRVHSVLMAAAANPWVSAARPVTARPLARPTRRRPRPFPQGAYAAPPQRTAADLLRDQKRFRDMEMREVKAKFPTDFKMFIDLA